MEFDYFPSRAEATRWGELLLQEAQGMISDLMRQPKFDLTVRGNIKSKLNGEYKWTTIGKFMADFEYERDGEIIVEDVKGTNAPDTPLSNWKRKHVEVEYGLNVQIIRR